METTVAKKHAFHVAATTGNGAELDLKGSCREHTLYIEGSAGISAGAVQLETAAEPGYTGTWAAIGSAVTVTATAIKIVQFSGVLGVVRARISTNMTGGTVSCYLFAN